MSEWLQGEEVIRGKQLAEPYGARMRVSQCTFGALAPPTEASMEGRRNLSC
jgi:hypothetical protein